MIGIGRRHPGGRSCYRVLIWFVATVVAVEAAVAANAGLWQSYDPNPYASRLAAYDRSGADLLIVGGSTAMCGLDPAILAGTSWHGEPLRRAFNLAVPLATTTDICHIVEFALRRPPKLIVYGVMATDLHDGRTESISARYLMGPADVLDWASTHPANASYALRHYTREHCSRLWPSSYHAYAIQLWLADHANRVWPSISPESAAIARANRRRAGEIATDGYQRLAAVNETLRFDRQKAAGLVGDGFSFLEGYHCGGPHLGYLHRLLDSAKRANVPVVLLDLPVPADLDERMYPAAFEAYRALLANVARSHGVPLVHATRTAIGLTDADFSDLAHVNAAGAAKLSHWLRTSVAGLCEAGSCVQRTRQPASQRPATEESSGRTTP
ncbi:MAG TPA: hypothetical protein VL371_02400 [Gemmataceae bacterium]|nr:hypothetical protein [Gemmataceae bacterium]